MSGPEDLESASEVPLGLVELLGLPLVIAHRSNEHHATLTRELALVEAGADPSAPPGKLLRLAAELQAKYGRFGDAQRDRAVAAAAAGGDAVDLRYNVPASVADDAIELARLYDEVDDYCLTGELVSLMTPPDVRDYRQWLVDQFVAQIRDRATPRPWESPTQSHVDAAPAAISRPDTLLIEGDLDFPGAAEARNVISRLVEEGVTDLTVDLGACEFVDSIGISLLLTTLIRLRDSGGSLVVVNANEAVRSTLTYAGVIEMLVRD